MTSTFLSQALPDGFHNAIDTLNKIPIAIMSEMALKTVSSLQSKGIPCYVDEYSAKIKASPDAELDSFYNLEEEVGNVIIVLVYIFKTAFRLAVPLAEFQQAIRKNSQLDVERIKALFAVYEKSQSINNSKSWKAFELQRLKCMDWKLSVGLASHCCQHLSSARITVTFTVEKEQKEEKHTMDLTLEEFQELHQHFTEMAEAVNQL